MDQQKEGQRDKAATTYYPLGSILRKEDPNFYFVKRLQTTTIKLILANLDKIECIRNSRKSWTGQVTLRFCSETRYTSTKCFEA